MKSPFSNLRRARKVFLIGLIPVLGALGFLINDAREKTDRWGQLEAFERASSLSVKISAVVHELQMERGASTLFLGSKGTMARKELDRQRGKTDESIKEFNEALQEFAEYYPAIPFQSRLDEAVRSLSFIGEKRAATNTLRSSSSETISFYTGSITALLESIQEAVRTCTDPVLSMGITAYLNLLQGEEKAGLELAVLSDAFAADSFTPELLRLLFTTVVEQDLHLHAFLWSCRDDQHQFYRKHLNTSSVEDAKRLRNLGFAKSKSRNLGVDPTVWFDVQAARIQSLREVETHFTSDLLRRSRSLRFETESSIYLPESLARIFHFSLPQQRQRETDPQSRIANR